MLEEGHLFIILHAPPEPDQDEREARLFWRLPDANWKSSFGKAGTTALADHIREFHQKLEQAEKIFVEANGADDYFEALERVNPLYRAARNMHQALQQARDFITDEQELISRRDEAYATERTAELLQADIRHAFELYVARQTEEMSKSSHRMALAGHRLNTLVAIFFPTATLAAVLGMNVQTGLERLQPPLPMVGVLLAGACLGAGVKSWLEREPVERGSQTPQPTLHSTGATERPIKGR